MNYDIDLRRAIKSEEFKEYWAAKDVMKNYRVVATKRTLSIKWDDGSTYATFEVKLFEDLDLGVGIYCQGDLIDEQLELDTFDCTENEIAKSMIYYFRTRF